MKITASLPVLLAISSYANLTLAQTIANDPTFLQTMCFDDVLLDHMNANNIPGISTAVMKDGNILYQQGYGLGNAVDGSSDGPIHSSKTTFRIASLSKPITSLTILKMEEQGLLSLTEKVFGAGGVLQDFMPQENILDQRILDITVDQLLMHQGGWDRSISDPMFQTEMIAAELGRDYDHASCEDVMQYMLEFESLQFSPGQYETYRTDQTDNYSNFGYCILGRVVDQKAGMHYEDAVRKFLLEPAGVSPQEMYLGRSFLEDIPLYETEYLHRNDVSVPYHGFSLEAMDAHGGWVATATALMKVVALIDNELLDKIITQPGSFGYGRGFLFNSVGNIWHNGRLPGTSSLMVRTHGGYSWVILVNTDDYNTSQDDPKMWEAFECVLERNEGTFPAMSA